MTARALPGIGSMFDLSGRVALVTGGSRGLGKALARALAEAGADIVIASRHESELTAAAAEIAQGLGGQARHLVADLGKRDQVERLAAEAIEVFGHVDILVDDAGVFPATPLAGLTDRMWDDTLQVNLTAGLALSRALAPGMRERRWGRIIQISSIAARAAAPDHMVYSVAKAAACAMIRGLALELGPYGITANAILPGPFRTEMSEQGLTDENRRLIAERTMLGRWGEPREIGGLVVLLASEAGSYITGAELVIDGGLLSRL
jgi:NAD(P)-dependent dehydrogenase (short-subunit alcohol dehydrogenase family)